MTSWLKYRVKIRFQEMLALIVVIPFLIFTILVLFGEKDMEILRVYVPLISIILGGYFGQGAIREWKGKEIEPVVEQKQFNKEGYK